MELNLKEQSLNIVELLTGELFENLEEFIKKYTNLDIDMDYMYMILMPNLIAMMTAKLFGHLSEDDRTEFIECTAMLSKEHIKRYLTKE